MNKENNHLGQTEKDWTETKKILDKMTEQLYNNHIKKER